MVDELSDEELCEDAQLLAADMAKVLGGQEAQTSALAVCLLVATVSEHLSETTRRLLFSTLNETMKLYKGVLQ